MTLYGCKYRPPCNLSPDDILISLSDYLESFITAKSRKYALHKYEFSEWKDRVMEIIKNRTQFYINNIPTLFSNSGKILDKWDIKYELKRLQEQFIITSVDKASNNFVFICKKFYVQTLLNELGFDFTTMQCRGNETYSRCPYNESYYDKSICDHISSKFTITVNDKNQCLPRIFWNPKLHKMPYKAKFIAGARHCVTKTLNIILNQCLKTVREYFRKYCLAIYRNTGIDCFWSINSTLDFLNNLNDKTIFNMQVFDFATLYTRLDLSVVEQNINGVIDLIFSDRSNIFR